MDHSINYSLNCYRLLTIVICTLKKLLTNVFLHLPAHSILKHKHIIFSSEKNTLWNSLRNIRKKARRNGCFRRLPLEFHVSFFSENKIKNQNSFET